MNLILRKTVLICFLMASFTAHAQEMNVRVRVLDNQLPTTVDKKIFRTLESALTNFINKRKWTNETFASKERIECQFLINLASSPEPNVYSGSITIQAARPIYQSSYVSPIINYQDPNFDFKYVESQPLEFNENRVTGADPLASNLTAVIAFYVYTIIAFDFESFTMRGGEPYFQKALNIVNNAPDANQISGWKSYENNNRNRYWLATHMLNNRYTIIHDIYYSYYRKGLDLFYENEEQGRGEIIQALDQLDVLHRENPNLMIVQFFMLGKFNELVGVFKKAPAKDKVRALEILTRLDVSNSNRYKQELK